MSTINIEWARQQTTEELAIIVWDWYKEVHGIRPRWVSQDDREFFLSFIEFETRPEIVERRAEEAAEASDAFKEWRDEMRVEEMLADQMEEILTQEARELDEAYDDTYYYLEEKLCS